MKGIDSNGPESDQVASVDVVIENGGPQPPQQPEENGAQDGEEREITLTDHLNKKLLSSFLDRINQNPSMIPTECSRTDSADEFEDDNT